jgi:hypothetical protein
MLGWLAVPDTAYQGPIFEFVDGEFLDGCRMPGILTDLLRVVGLLHADRELAQKIASNGLIRTYLDCFRSRYIDMLREDLKMIQVEPPPFISPSRLRWMSEEVDALEKQARESGAFGETLQAVTHWDLWWNNVLVSPSGQWYILDWDDMGFGDPALDYSAIVFPLTCSPINRDWHSFSIPYQGEAFSVRMALYCRAQVLDGVIDVLADWIECRDVPASQAEVQAGKQAEHEHSFRIYQAEYCRD